MNDAFHERVMQVLGDALEVGPERRADFIERACAREADVRAEVERLLHGQGRATAAIPTAHGAQAAMSALLAASQIGPYKLIRPLGEGGMGVVYLAIQEHPVRRTVALKLIRPGMDSREVVSRFESERQALAMMNHPNVAQVYDAGASDTGRPYFVMEYVEGEPITDWCDKNRRTMRQRLELFIQVCDAVQHAHQKGIIHRDLKPTNVLVATSDSKPIPKVIDFGIAKAMEQKPDEHSMLTQMGQLVGTPEYMSPEQAADATDIDTRTDVYALGVLLYELLAGVLPFDRKLLRSSAYDELRRIIREIEAVKPSSRLGRLDPPQSREIAQARACEPGALRRALGGDLDWIVLKALEKDRERRYASPGELAADIQRHLRDEPVDAGPPTTTYRLRKFVRRHRAAVLAAAFVFLVLIAGMITTTWQAVRAIRAERAIRLEQQKTLIEQQRTLEQKSIAEKRFNDLRKLAGAFMFDVDETLQTAGPTKAREKLVNTAIEYLDALAKETADSSLAKELVQGYLRVGSVQFYPGTAHLGDPPGALQNYRKALEIAQRLVAQNPDDPDSQRLLGGCWIYVAEAQANLSEHDAAIQSFADARTTFQHIVDRHPTELISRRNIGLVCEKLANLYERLGRGQDSLDSRNESLKIYESVLAEQPDNPMFLRDVTLAHGGLGALLMDMGRISEALVHSRKAAELSEKRLALESGNPHYQRDVMLHTKDVATILRLLGRPVDAIAPARRAVEVSLAMVNADQANLQARRDLAGAYTTLGEALLPAGRTAESIEVLRRAIEIRIELFQQTPTDTRLLAWNANSREALADSLRAAGNLGEALAEVQAAAEAQQQRREAEPENLAIVSSMIETGAVMGRILLEQDRVDDALDHLEKIAALRTPAPQNITEPVTDRRYMLPMMLVLADARNRAGKTDQAIVSYDEVIRLGRALLEQDSGDDWVRGLFATALARRGMIQIARNELQSASELINEAIDEASQVASRAACGTEAQEALWQARVAEAQLQSALGHDAEAGAAWGEALRIAQRLSDADSASAHMRRLVDETVSGMNRAAPPRP